MFIPLSSLQQAQEHSQKEKVIIFKHSTTCPISADAYHELEEGLTDEILIIPVYILIVQDQRSLSNEISEMLGVKHESPQCIVMENSDVVLVLNHHYITVDNIQSVTKKDFEGYESDRVKV